MYNSITVMHVQCYCLLIEHIAFFHVLVGVVVAVV